MLFSPPPSHVGHALAVCFRDTEPFDWYQRYEGIKNVLERYVQPTHKVLMSGAGNSRECLPSCAVMPRAPRILFECIALPVRREESLTPAPPPSSKV